MNPEYFVTPRDVGWVADQLMKFGGRAGWNAGLLVPLTPYQEEVARLLSLNRTFDSYLAGGAAIHLEPHTKPYSNDLDYFHDSVERVASAYAGGRGGTHEARSRRQVEMRLPGYIRQPFPAR